MDKNSIIGYVLIFVIFAGWLMYSSNKTELEQQAFEKEQLRADSIAKEATIDPLKRAAEVAKNAPQTTTEAVQEEAVATGDDTTPEIVALPETVYGINNAKKTIQLTTKGW